ncbi:MAG TPA: class I SAM-dependent methyltransferase [Myxococcota bacterium]|nr:class I SAM-dependent methyltransferase [Myxococcota bacterium]
MPKKKPAPRAPLPPFDKYLHYTQAVQAPDENMAFLRDIYREQREGRAGLTLREDFCGTFANSIAWVLLDDGHVAHGLDIDPEPLDYGRRQYLPTLPPEVLRRVHIAHGDVLESPLATCDIAAALNFACCFFRDRKTLSRYLTRVRDSLAPGGIFVTDLLGGPFYQDQNEHELELDEPHPFSYFLEQTRFDPITGEGDFAIHFKRRGEAKRRAVFTYTFRLWSIPELRELLLELGFADVKVYWEGSRPDGSGDGIWRVETHGDACDSWLAYVVALK